MSARVWLIAAIALAGIDANAASPAIVQEYADLSAAFDASLGRPPVQRELQVKRADCVLTEFEADRGAENTPQLMELMRTLAQGVQFDDPVVVKFTAAHGDAYAEIVRRCKNSV